MTREEYIKKVKVLLDEVSPFDEPANFIAANGDTDYEEVKPIVSYIDGCLDKAAQFCLNNLPLSLLSQDITKSSYKAKIDRKCVGHIGSIYDYLRLVRLHDDAEILERDVTYFISMYEPSYLLQQNMHTRGGVCKPIVAYSPDTAELEIYSYPRSCRCEERNYTMPITLYYIDCHISAEQVLSPIEDYIALMCASYVEEIIGDVNAAANFQQEYEKLKATILI